MTPHEQRMYVALLCDTIRNQVLRAIDEGKIPETWESLELRWLVESKINMAGLPDSLPKKNATRSADFAKICRERYLV